MPLVLHLTGGNVVDCTAFNDVPAKLRIRRPAGDRPRIRPDVVIGDKGYSTRTIGSTCAGVAASQGRPARAIRRDGHGMATGARSVRRLRSPPT
ncbi:hypothetical protein [Nonomuraea ceibae]|uniref:hypothetical protein n=1 Tax=Nonomuraea ceibae TaxID=1935170 RepID=UPI001C603852|nr:hypothetical protein [Nonomuraea ceibae]